MRSDTYDPPKATDRRAGYIRWFADLTNEEVAVVGGKNASLGEMVGNLGQAGISVPDGFATTADAYRRFVHENELDEPIRDALDRKDRGQATLEDTGRTIRSLILNGAFPGDVEAEIRQAYRALSERYGGDAVDVAVRSSATAEDLPEASFAGQLESYLNVTGEDELLHTCRRCYASLFTDRGISYREERGFDHMEIALSVGVQKMVRSDTGSAGVLFTLDTETGFPDVVIIDAAWGLGESVVQGRVNPDRYMVFKPLLKADVKPILEKARGEKEQKVVYSDDGSGIKSVETNEKERLSYVLSDPEILKLATWGMVIEDHYGRPMDVEWAKDGETDQLFIVQARPETVQSRESLESLRTYTLREEGHPLVRGVSVGNAIASGTVRRIEDPGEGGRFRDGDILVTERTDPDWGPILNRAGGVVTDLGGRTSHAAIVSRELGVPAIVGTENGTQILEDGIEVTVSCAEGDEGIVYEGLLDFETAEVNLEGLPDTKTRIMLNIANPAASFRWWRLPCRGVGLARLEFTIGDVIGIHPMALARFEAVEDPEIRRQIEEQTKGYDDRAEYFVERLAWGVAKIAASQYPDPVIVRTSDFKTSEYAELLGGEGFEPRENNPMLGFRGASRYYSERYRPGFELECRAIRRVRDEIGLENVVVMIPFCRTLNEADRVLEVLAENGLQRGANGLEVYVMAEVPSNVFLAEEFGQRFDGFSIGSNDLTQLVLGVDRDSEELATLFNERDGAVKRAISDLIERAHECGTPVGICGQAPSDYPDFAAFLVREGIDSISLNPDSVVEVLKRVAEVEGECGR
jgi:pyruvate,water dikinase